MSKRGGWHTYNVGWETRNEGELVGSYRGESEAVAIREAKQEMRDANIKFPHDAKWSAVIV